MNLKKINKKKTLAYIGSLLFFYFILESSIFLIFKAQKIDLISNNGFENKEEIISRWREGGQSIHPYLGYTWTYQKGGNFSEYGFLDKLSPIQEKSDGKLIVGIFGGSVATGFCFTEGAKALENQLKQIKKFSGRKIILLNFALAGYKQPQQLMVLNYILSMGGQFDIVINIDGFNEMALPVAENIPAGVFPFFPRGWDLRIAPFALDREELLMMAKIISAETRIRQLAEFFSGSPMRYSPLARLICLSLDSQMNKQLQKNKTALYEYRKKNKVNDYYAASGPKREYKNTQAMYQDLALFWEKCSLLMNQICQANGIQYFHFLQPSQYVPGSKIMREDEARIAINLKHPYREPVIKGYPLLIAMGREMVSQRENFYDLTMIFKDYPELLYIDDMCHFNENGNIIMGNAIGSHIVDKLQNLQ